MLEKIVISGGPSFLSVGAEYSLGRKDKSPVIKRHTTYFESLNGLSSSYVVLYDVQDHRAWLSNGLHTLLHLVRASLKEDQKGDFSDECLLNRLGLEEEADVDAANPEAAIKFLKNRRNLEQPVLHGLDEIYTEHTVVAGQSSTTHRRTNTTVRLKDRIIQIMDVLWQLIDHQATLEGLTSAVSIRPPRSKLEGYRFMEVATRRAMTPRVVYLKAFNGAGKSWVDFIRAIRAVVLFGGGFGDLISPRPTTTEEPTQSTVCSRWRVVPTGRDYLAISGYDLARILHQEGSAASNPVRLAPGIHWIPSTTAFEQCVCDCRNRERQPPNMFRVGPLLRRQCDRVQVLLPGRLARVPRGTISVMRPIDRNSAVIFGKSELFPWRWPDQGDPMPEDPSETEASASDAAPSFLRIPIGTSTRTPSTSGQSRVTSLIATPPTTVTSPESSQGGHTNAATLPSTGGGRADTQSKRGLRRMLKSLWKR